MPTQERKQAKGHKVTQARIRLRQAIDRACIARGEAQWTNGYRTGRKPAFNDPEDQRLYLKEMAQFKVCERAEATAERAMRAYAKAIREALHHGSGGK